MFSICNIEKKNNPAIEQKSSSILLKIVCDIAFFQYRIFRGPAMNRIFMRLLLVAMASNLVASLLLVAMPFAPSSVLAPSSDGQEPRT